MPDKKYIEWSFDETNYSAVLENLKNCILNFAQPYFDRLDSSDKINCEKLQLLLIIYKK